jgi:DNA-binding transcriptional ArsR family regulator
MPSSNVPPRELRRIDDARILRALSHPVRIALLEALGLHGPLTATQAAELIGETPTTCSFHLRQLAKYGFVAEAGGGRGRERPWRAVAPGFVIASSDAGPAVNVASEVLMGLLRERWLARYRSWLARRAAYPEAWRHATGESEHLLFVTADELANLQGELDALIAERFGARLHDPQARPADAMPVEVLILSYPLDTLDTGDGNANPA